jgi:hypothetical protein
MNTTESLSVFPREDHSNHEKQTTQRGKRIADERHWLVSSPNGPFPVNVNQGDYGIQEGCDTEDRQTRVVLDDQEDYCPNPAG